MRFERNVQICECANEKKENVDRRPEKEDTKIRPYERTGRGGDWVIGRIGHAVRQSRRDGLFVERK